MSMRIVTDGQDRFTKPIIDHLITTYGIEPWLIRRVQLDSPVGDVQTITVTLLLPRDEEDERAWLECAHHADYASSAEHARECPRHGIDAAVDENTVLVPLIGHTRDEQPRGSHAPTNCVFQLPVGPGGDAPTLPCGELIRWHQDYVDTTPRPGARPETVPGMGYWVHVSDGRLGTSTHPATPGY